MQRGLELLFEPLLTPIENIHCLLVLQDNEAAFSVCTVNFHDREHGIILAFGTAKGLWFWPKRSLIAGFIQIYKFLDDGKSLELVHKTGVEGAPLALCRFQGRYSDQCRDCMTWGRRRSNWRKDKVGAGKA